MKLAHIFRYPVKGLSPESLPEIHLSAGLGLPFDRRFAITHGRSVFDFDNPQWLARRNFLVVAHCPRLAALQSSYDHGNGLLSLQLEGKQVLQVKPSERSDLSRLNEFLTAFIGAYQYGPYRFAEVPDTSLTDSPLAGVSLMNLASLRELETAAGRSLDVRRFRGNLWFDGEQPWQEFDWLDREIALGDVRLKIIERIERCAAINASPDTGKRDIDGLRILQNHFYHRDFGMLAQVIHGGIISVGDSIFRQ